MAVSSDRKLPVYRRNPLAFGAVVLVALVLIVMTVGWVDRQTGWLRIPGIYPGRVPNPPTSGGYVTSVPGLSPAVTLRPTRVMTEQERRAELDRCRPLLDMRNPGTAEARQKCRDILNAATIQR